MKDEYGFEKTRIDGAKIISVICIESAQGDGTEKNPTKRVEEFYSLSGVKIGELNGSQCLSIIDNALSASFPDKIK
ncbi:hypothetical protein [Megasphaera sueciensis]|uniref:hypothetical protein n=1 Tax=Megasphaera sueciensis TaxID=349094 RepID=UPI003D003E9B